MLTTVLQEWCTANCVAQWKRVSRGQGWTCSVEGKKKKKKLRVLDSHLPCCSHRFLSCGRGLTTPVFAEGSSQSRAGRLLCSSFLRAAACGLSSLGAGGVRVRACTHTCTEDWVFKEENFVSKLSHLILAIIIPFKPQQNTLTCLIKSLLKRNIMLFLPARPPTPWYHYNYCQILLLQGGTECVDLSFNMTVANLMEHYWLTQPAQNMLAYFQQNFMFQLNGLQNTSWMPSGWHCARAFKIENAACFLLFFIKKCESRSTDLGKPLTLSFPVGKSTINQTRIILCMFLFLRRLQGLHLRTWFLLLKECF